MESVLYGDGGYFTHDTERAGFRGDFVTSVALGDLFGRVMARRIWAWADDRDVRPVRVADAGGGAGDLTKVLRHAGLDAVTVERSEAARRRAAADGVPAVASLADLPWRPDVVVAHELLDNLRARLIHGGDKELRVGFDDSGTCLFHVPLDDELERFRDRWIPAGAAGVVPVPVGAADWLTELGGYLAHPGLVLIVDYGGNASDLGARGDWPVRGYRDHREVDPIAFPGETDVTCDVPFDSVAAALQDDGFTVERTRQRDWLDRWGISDVAASGAGEGAAAVAGADATTQLRAWDLQSQERDLTAPDGLGAFWVLEAEQP